MQLSHEKCDDEKDEASVEYGVILYSMLLYYYNILYIILFIYMPTAL